MRRQETKKQLLSFIPILGAILKDLRKENHRKVEEIETLKQNMINELGNKGKIVDKTLTPVVYQFLKKEKISHIRRVKKRKQVNPKTLLTKYGDFDYIVRGIKDCLPADFVSVKNNLYAR